MCDGTQDKAAVKGEQVPGTIYKVWVEIEEYDEIAGIGSPMDAPGASLATFDSFEEAYRFAESVTWCVDSVRLKPNVPQDVRDHLDQLLEYLSDERRDAYEQRLSDPAWDPEGHIVSSLVAIGNWLDGTSYTVDAWLED